MSVVCCVYTSSGIVLAADSRLTRTKEETINRKKVTTKYSGSELVEKNILFKTKNIGLLWYGNAYCNNMHIVDAVREFEKVNVKISDTIYDIVKKFNEYANTSETTFFICGYDKEVPYVYEIHKKKITRINITKDEETNSTTLRYGVRFGGQITVIEKIVNHEPSLNTSYKYMTLADAIEFSKFLIDTTIKYQYFSDELKTCGGPIDVLVITKDNAFWSRHKIYNPIK